MTSSRATLWLDHGIPTAKLPSGTPGVYGLILVPSGTSGAYMASTLAHPTGGLVATLCLVGVASTLASVVGVVRDATRRIRFDDPVLAGNISGVLNAHRDDLLSGAVVPLMRHEAAWLESVVS